MPLNLALSRTHQGRLAALLTKGNFECDRVAVLPTN